MFRRSARAIRENIFLLIVFSFVITGANEIQLWILQFPLYFFASGLFAFLSHRMLLKKERFGIVNAITPKSAGGEPLSYGTFLLIFGGFWLCLIVIFGASFLAYYLLLGAGVVARQSTGVAGLLTVGGAFFIYGMLLSRIGSLFPAAALNGDTSLKRALARGRTTYGKTFWRLSQGVIVVLVLAVGTTLLTYPFISSPLLSLDHLSLLASFVASVFGSVMTLFAAAALSMAYEESEEVLNASS